RRPQETPTAGGDDDVLAAVLAEERDRRGVRAGRQVSLPELPACFRLEGPEAAIDCRADENDAAGCRDAAADVQRARLVEPFGFERREESERNSPRHVTTVHVERDQFAERR